MKKEESIFYSKLWLPILVIFTFIFIVFSNRFGNVGIGDQVLFLLTQIVFVAIPGMALVLWINPPEDRLILVISSYMAGYAVNIALFFLFCAIGLAGQFTICMTIVSIFCSICIIKKRDLLIRMKSDHSGMWVVTILLIVLLTGILFQTTANYNTPDFTENTATYIYQDLAWNVGNTTAISNGLPIMDIHVEGISFGYHYFVNVFAAMYKNILGVSSYLIYMKLIPVAQVFFLIGGFYLLFSTLSKKKWRLLFMICVSIICSLLILVHMFWFSYATAFGMGLSLAATFYLLRFIRKIDAATFFNRDFLMFLIFLAAVTGSKIMYAVPCLAGFTVLAVIQIIRWRNAKNVFLSLVLMVASFGTVYWVTSFGIYGFNSFEFGFAQIIWNDPLYLAMLAKYPFVPVFIFRSIVYAIYTLKCYLPFVVASASLIIWLFRLKGRKYPIKVFLLAAMISCYIAFTILIQNGLSQLMFINAIAPLSVYTLFYIGNHIRQSKAKMKFKALYILFIVFISVFYALDAFQYLSTQAQKSVSLRNDVSTVSAQNVIYKDEYEGMVWLRDNTEKNDVFAADRFYFDDVQDILHARYFNYTAISERQCYLEGFEYIYSYDKDFKYIVTIRLEILKGVYDNDFDSLQRLYNDGVDYLVCSRRIHPDFKLKEEFGSPVFENGGMIIYKLNENP